MATVAQLAVALRSWNGANCRSQVAELQTPAVEDPPEMIFWPFLFFQKPIVSAPVFAGPHASTDVLADWPVSVMVAVFG